MNRFLAIVVVVMLVLVGAMGLRTAAVAHSGNSPVMMANGGGPVPPQPWKNGGGPVPPQPWKNGGGPVPPQPWK